MTISVQSTIELDINGQKLKLTHSQALTLWQGLCKVLGKDEYSLTYPPGVRSIPSTPSPVPNNVPPMPWHNPIIYGDRTAGTDYKIGGTWSVEDNNLGIRNIVLSETGEMLSCNK